MTATPGQLLLRFRPLPAQRRFLLARDPEWVHKIGERWALRLHLRETI